MADTHTHIILTAAPQAVPSIKVMLQIEDFRLPSTKAPRIHARTQYGGRFEWEIMCMIVWIIIAFRAGQPAILQSCALSEPNPNHSK
jgi:hypothetical protein